MNFADLLERSTTMRRLAPVVLTALALGVTACGGDDGGSGGAGSGGDGNGEPETLTIYSSTPLQGASREQSVSIVNGIDLALDQAGGKAGKFKIKHESLDDSTAQAAGWAPEQVSANARKALRDKSTIAYIGEYNGGASAVSMPILNEGPIPQISPTNAAIGLTREGPGTAPGEPDKYYPTGVRHYVRVLPTDMSQGAALVQLMKEEGCKAVYMTNDNEVYGKGVGGAVEFYAKQSGLNLLANESLDKSAPNYRSVAAKIKATGADCFMYAGVTANNAVQIYKDINAAMPDAKLFGSDGLPEPAFTDPAQGGVPLRVAEKILITVPVLPTEGLPEAGKEFFAMYKERFGKSPTAYGIAGYEAMSLALDAIKRAGDKGNDRKAVIEQLFATKDRESVLGKYSIDKNGDSTLYVEGIYGIKDGELVFNRSVDAAETVAAAG
jgi:branched-chain amino acid transport system substrate-binding protein